MSRTFKHLIGALAVTFCFTYPVSAEQTESTPERFAEKHFKQIVLDQIQGDAPSNYHMTDSTDITFGPLHEKFMASKSCYQADGACTIVSTNEYVSTVIQDGEPVNLISTYEQAPDTYAFAGFGSSKDTPAALLDLEGQLVQHAPNSTWFDFDGETLTALTPSSVQFIGADTISLKGFQQLLSEGDAQGDAEEGYTGGTDDSDTTRSNTSRLIGFAFVAMLPLGFWMYRSRKKK